ncbi:MAG: BCD family MFS transporter [Anaerolineales bacterium]|nr:BCD family MFS transporter [Anaerolineales bacterium]MCX7756027.1 BCD family MFS transporter [Anaerolineales bacterium]MDW8277035.1 BCD family MFS transporter [Anaerolineales bacterium]
MWRKRLQLGLIHVAVAMTLVPINSTLNRVMIKELGIAATVVAILAILPYLFSPMQVAIGSFSDRYPLLGYRRSPYILAGLFLCVIGVVVSPQVAFLMVEQPLLGYLTAGLAFGAWGMGYNLSSVSYLALANELSGENGRGKTIATMWFMMIVSIIFTAIAISRLVEPYSPEALQMAFIEVGITALVLGGVGLLGLEKRYQAAGQKDEQYSFAQMAAAILKSRQATTFFWYLALLLAAILGQDVLLEPFAAEAFGMTVQQTTRITSIWGVAVLLTILLAGALERRAPRKAVAQTGNLTVLAGFLLILASGALGSTGIFYSGVILLGAGTGLSTVANLALMFDLTLPGYVGLFIGAWGVANSISRLVGTLLAGIVRDGMTWLTNDVLVGYLVVFGIEAMMVALAAFLLLGIDTRKFYQQVEAPSITERAALAD